MAGKEFLTETQREYLRGDHETPTKNAEQQMRKRIRENTRQALHDLALVSQTIERRDMHQIAWQKKDSENQLAPEYQPAGFTMNIIPSIISILFRIWENQDVASEITERGFARYTERGIEDALEKEGWYASVSADLKIRNNRSFDEIWDRLETEGPDAVSHGELRSLVDAGQLSHVEHAELMLEKEGRVERPDGMSRRQADDDSDEA